MRILKSKKVILKKMSLIMSDLYCRIKNPKIKKLIKEEISL